MKVGGTLFAIWLGLALIVGSVGTVTSLQPISFVYWWSASLLFTSCVILLWAQQQVGSGELKGSDRFWYVVLTLLALGLRLWNLDGPSIWMDEDVQAITSTVRGGLDLVLAAANQQQPPLDYFFTAFNLRMLGWNEWGSRASAWLLGSLAVGSIFLIGVRANISRIPLVLVTVLAAVNPWLIRYAQEGRPISTAMFCNLLLLLQIFSYWRSPSRVGLMAVWAASNFFLLSIGFQPPLLLLSLFVTGFLALAFNPATRGKFIKLSGAVMASVAFCLPILLLTVQKSPVYFASGERLARLFNLGHRKMFLDFLASFFGHPLANGFVVLIIMGALFLPRRELGQRRLLGASSLLMVLSLALKYGVFYFFIQWFMNMRYLLVGSPIVFLVIALAIDQIRHGRWRQMAVSGLGAFVIWSCLQLPQAYSKVEEEGWKQLYSFLATDAEPESGVFLLAFTPAEQWSPIIPLAQDFYVSQDLRSRAFIPYDNTGVAANHLIEALLKPAQFKTVYLVDLPRWSGSELYPLAQLSEWREVPRHKFLNIVVYKVKIPEGTTFSAYLTESLARLEVGPWSPPNPFWLQYTLFALAIAKPDCARARVHFERLRPATALPANAQAAVDDQIQKFSSVCGPVAR